MIVAGDFNGRFLRARSGVICLILFLLGLNLTQMAATCQAAQRTHVVKRGDTLFDIGKKYDVSVAELSERNSLGRSSHIVPGQRLVIPSRPSTSSSSPKTAAVKPDASTNILPESLREAISRAPVRAGRWKYIVVHHSGVDAGTVKGMDRYHREVRHMENGLAYHFVIGNGNGMPDGQITASRRWISQLEGGHLASASQNRYALGICLVGNFDRHGPSQKQLQSLKGLIKALMTRCNLKVSAVKGHKEINVIGTRCPGSKFSMAEFRKSF